MAYHESSKKKINKFGSFYQFSSLGMLGVYVAFFWLECS